MAPLLECRTLRNSATRLACFDRESAVLAAAESAGIGVSSPPISAPAVAATAAFGAPGAAALPSVVPQPVESKENFGLPEKAIAQQEVAAGLRSAELKKIDAHLVAVSVAAGGEATFTLDNGQVWRELKPDGDLLAKPGDVATISLGVFHSYSLQLKSARSAKVTRIR